MFRGILAGAGLVALIDLAVRLPLTAAGFWREVALLVCLGVVLAGLLTAAAVGLWKSKSGRLPSAGSCFWIGVAIAAVPPVGALLPKSSFGLLVLLLGLPLAPRLGRWKAPSGLLASALAAFPFVCAPLLFLLPGMAPLELPARTGPLGAEGPDVILISCDTLRADVFDQAGLELPELRALRQRGTWAPYAVAASSSTRPSHVTMLSGLPAFAHAVVDNQWKMAQDVELVSERFHQAGWRTAAVVSNAMISARSGFDRGFEVFDETPIVRRHFRNEDLADSSFSLSAFLRPAKKGTWIGWLGLLGEPLQDLLLLDWKGLPPNQGNGAYTLERAKGLLDELQAGESPYFLFFHLMDPHTPYLAPGDFAEADDRARDLTPLLGEAGRDIGEWTAVNAVEQALAGGVEDAAPLLDPVRRVYFEEVRFVDALIGELLDHVEASGRPTVVLFTADHGEQFGEHGLMLHSNSLWEPSLRVPFILVGPGIPARPLDSPPQHKDVAPTLLAAAGLPVEGFTGRSLGGEPGPPRPHVSRYHEFLAVRDGRWKMIFERGEDGEFVSTGLYDLEADPGELVDRRDEQPAEVARLSRLAQAAIEVERAVGGVELDTDPEHQGAMAELGYAGH